MSELSTNDLYGSLRPAERYSALEALKSGIEAELKVIKGEILGVADAVGVKSFSTSFGTVNVSQKDAPVLINEFKLFDYVKENSPEIIETVERVPDWYAKQLSDAKSMQLIDGEYYDLKGGHLPFATVGDQPDPYVAWPASKEQKVGKAEAREFVRANASQMSAAVLGLEPTLAIAAAPVPETIQVVEAAPVVSESTTPEVPSLPVSDFALQPAFVPAPTEFVADFPRIEIPERPLAPAGVIPRAF